MSSTWLLTADIGGTWTRAARYPWPWNKTEPPPRDAYTRQPTDPQHPTASLIRALEAVWPEQGSVHGIAVAAPGPLNPNTGVVYLAPNLPGWKEEPLQEHLEAHFGVPVRLGNDANLAALGEARFGAGQGCRDLIYLTLSTGVGGGVLCGGRLLLGAQGLAAELGHITLLPDGPLCSCGGRGHLEALVSGPALVRIARERLAAYPHSLLHTLEPLTGQALSRAAHKGDLLAQSILREAGTWVGRALADLCHIFNPERVLLGGGVSFSGPWLWEALHEALTTHLMSPRYIPQVLPARLGDDAGLYGAYALWQEETL